jgi:hypothetical protein
MRIPRSGLAAPAAAILAVLAAGACRSSDTRRPPGSHDVLTGPAGADSSTVRRDITYLASDALEGRGTGTPGNDSAAAYLARRYQGLGLRPLTQRFTARSEALAHAGQPFEFPAQNVVVEIAGTDPRLAGQWVVVGAHYDHLGRSSEGALDPERVGEIHHGADDNASGTAAVLELARLFARHPARRGVIFVNFSGEELGLLGSEYFVAHPPIPLDSVQAMINFDMIGRLRQEKLIVYGIASAAPLKPLLDSLNALETPPFALTAIGDGFGPSDQSSFYEHHVPVLHFFTDLHDDYHKVTDVASKVNAGGEAQVIDYAEHVVRELADRPDRLTFIGAPAPSNPMASSQGDSKVYFGSVPDMAAGDAPGLRLTSVRPGSPADKAGLHGGDVIVAFDGQPVKDLYSYSAALYAHKPGDTVAIVVLRDGARLTLTATLGTRGG